MNPLLSPVSNGRSHTHACAAITSSHSLSLTLVVPSSTPSHIPHLASQTVSSQCILNRRSLHPSPLFDSTSSSRPNSRKRAIAYAQHRNRHASLRLPLSQPHNSLLPLYLYLLANATPHSFFLPRDLSVVLTPSHIPHSSNRSPPKTQPSDPIELSISRAVPATEPRPSHASSPKLLASLRTQTAARPAERTYPSFTPSPEPNFSLFLSLALALSKPAATSLPNPKTPPLPCCAPLHLPLCS